MSDCPCCSQSMLRHIRSNEVYWFCRNCWQEMPNFQENRGTPISVKLSTALGIREQIPALMKR